MKRKIEKKIINIINTNNITILIFLFFYLGLFWGVFPAIAIVSAYESKGILFAIPMSWGWVYIGSEASKFYLKKRNEVLFNDET